VKPRQDREPVYGFSKRRLIEEAGIDDLDRLWPTKLNPFAIASIAQLETVFTKIKEFPVVKFVIDDLREQPPASWPPCNPLAVSLRQLRQPAWIRSHRSKRKKAALTKYVEQLMGICRPCASIVPTKRSNVLSCSR
jgi:hypothetical protein